MEVQAIGDAPSPTDGSSTTSTAPDPTSSPSTTGSLPATPTTKLPRLTSTSAPTTPTTVAACAPSVPVYALGLARLSGGNGWVSGANPALQRSTDGGKTWVPACLPAGAVSGPGGLNGVVFDADGRRGWVVGTSGGRPLALRTVDGGAHWLAARLPDGIAGSLTDVEFADQDHGWAVGNLSGTGPANAAGGLLLATTDGGAAWTAQLVPADVGRLSRIAIVDATHGWAVGVSSSGRPLIIATGDGGRNWSTQTLPDGIRELRDVAFADVHHGWAVGAMPVSLAAEAGRDDPGVILATTDGGATWTEQAVTVGSVWSIDAIDARTVFAGGGTGLFSTSDGGTTWTKQAFALPALDTISFTDADHGWVAHSMFSTVCRTEDGGRTWTASDVRVGGRGTACLPS
jgi:photosystem II stability/assembly factor-like uncharacterized protein